MGCAWEEGLGISLRREWKVGWLSLHKRRGAGHGERSKMESGKGAALIEGKESCVGERD